MFPIGDDNSQRKTFPGITYALIALNVLVFVLELGGGEPFVLKWAFVPSRFAAGPAADFPTVLSAMFMHAGWMHLIGNMLYLGIFGDNVEDRFGHLPYLIFYLLCGIAATFAQYAVASGSEIPNLGASGAIAGVLGAYLAMFPGARVSVFVIRGVVAMPALVVIGFWIALQFLSEIGSISSAGQSGGVAYMAHIGGFIAGLALTFVFRGGRSAGPAR